MASTTDTRLLSSYGFVLSLLPDTSIPIHTHNLATMLVFEKHEALGDLLYAFE